MEACRVIGRFSRTTRFLQRVFGSLLSGAKLLIIWRKGWDLNPRYGITVHWISSPIRLDVNTAYKRHSLGFMRVCRLCLSATNAWKCINSAENPARVSAMHWGWLMNVQKSVVTKLTITGAPALDPITVFLEDLEPRRGKITINCYTSSWTAYWGGMGDRTIAQFFCSCDEHYLAGNLSVGIEENIVDSESIKDGAFRQIISMRRGRMVRSRLSVDGYVRSGRGEIDDEEARKLWEEVQDTEFSDDGWSQSRLMQEIFGDEWWYRLPTKPNPAYQYLCRIIKAVQSALSLELKPILAPESA